MNCGVFNILVERVHKMGNHPNNSLRAFADISINNVIILKGFKILEGPKGLYVSSPQIFNKKTDNWKDTVIFADGKIRQQIEEIIINAYKKQE